MNKPPKPSAKDGFIRGTPTGSVLARHSLAILVGAGLLMMLTLSQLGENGIVSWFHLASREKQLREEVIALDALENDPWALEKIAREEQNMRRPEEEVLTVLTPDDQAR